MAATARRNDSLTAMEQRETLEFIFDDMMDLILNAPTIAAAVAFVLKFRPSTVPVAVAEDWARRNWNHRNA